MSLEQDSGCEALTHRLHSSSFLGLPYGMLNMNPKKELLWSLWVGPISSLDWVQVLRPGFWVPHVQFWLPCQFDQLPRGRVLTNCRRHRACRVCSGLSHIRVAGLGLCSHQALLQSVLARKCTRLATWSLKKEFDSNYPKGPKDPIFRYSGLGW